MLWKHVRREELHAEDALAAIADLSAASIRFGPVGGLIAQSLALSHGFTAYDATYVALATRVRGIVMTNDGEMRQRGIEAGLAAVTPREVA
jgi:predicted nucleic acid-binding protein